MTKDQKIKANEIKGYEINKAKDILANVVNELDAIGCGSQATQLERILFRLEAWQNNLKEG